MLEPPRTGASSTLHTVYPLKSCSQRRFGTVEGSMSKVCGVLSQKCEVDRQHRTSLTAAVQRNPLQGGCAPVRVGQAQRTSLHPLTTLPYRESKESTVWLNGFRVVQPEPPLPPALLRHHGMECDDASVWTQRTSANLLKTPAFRVSKVCRGLKLKCGAVREHPTSLPAAIIPNHPELL